MNEKTTGDRENEVERLMEAYFLRFIDTQEDEALVEEPSKVSHSDQRDNDSFDLCSCESSGNKTSEKEKSDASDESLDENSTFKESVASCHSEGETRQEPDFVVKLKRKYARQNKQFDATEFIRKRPIGELDVTRPGGEDIDTPQVDEECHKLPTPSEFARKNYQFIGLRDITYQAIKNNENKDAPLSEQLGKLYASYFRERNRKVRYTEDDKPMHPIFKEKTTLLRDYQALKKSDFSQVYREVFEEMKTNDQSPFEINVEPRAGKSSDFVDTDSSEALKTEATVGDPAIENLRDELFSFVKIGDEEDFSD